MKRSLPFLLLMVPHAVLAQSVEDPFSFDVLLRMSGGLLLVVALVFAAAWGVRRVGRLPTSGNSTVQLLGGIAVGQRERVVLIKVGDERLLLGVAPGRVQMLHTLTEEKDAGDEAIVEASEPEPQVSRSSEAFQKKLREILTRSGSA